MGRGEAARLARSGRLWLALGCALVGAGVYATSVGAGRIADDFTLVHTVREVHGLLWPFSRNDLGQAVGSGAFYRPLWVLWNAALYDMAHAPALAHVANLALFAAICAEAAWLVSRLFSARAAVIAAVFFAVFPSHGESVAWISGNTDLLATVLALGAVLVATGRRRTETAAPALIAAALTAAALLCKEVAAVAPVLAAAIVVADGRARESRAWRAPIAMAGAVVIVLIARTVVVGGVGGYASSSLTPKRALGSIASFTLAAASAPQLPLLRHPYLLVVPAAVMLVVALAIWRGITDGRARRLALAGLAWFYVALLPVLNQPLNLNTRNGDRLLLLGSVGLAITAGAVFESVRRRELIVAAAAVLVACAVLCVLDSGNWVSAGRESRRIVADVRGLIPKDGALTVLTVPSDYRQAHLFPDALQDAVRESGRPLATVTTCALVHPLSLSGGSVIVRQLPGGRWLATAARNDPFDISLFGASSNGGPGCAVSVAPTSHKYSIGTASAVIVTPAVRSSGIAYFNGRDVLGVAGRT
jgi:hypothetical protein